MSFELTILGCNSAIPISERNPTAQILNIFERFFLIDCGEGTQLQLRKFKFKLQRINHIFISHLHGDHYFGLIGLLSTQHLLGRKTPLHIYAHPDLEKIIQIQLKASDSKLNFEIIYHYLSYDKPEVLYSDKTISIETILLNHRIPCCGFLFKEHAKPRILLKEKLSEYQIPIKMMNDLKEGRDLLLDNGIFIKNKEVTLDPPAVRSYAYCSDTCYSEKIVEQIKGVSLLYHEATFMKNLESRAKLTFHSTTIDAGTIALKANVKKLIIGHFSSRYRSIEPLVAETKSVFSEAVGAEEGFTYKVD